MIMDNQINFWTFFCPVFYLAERSTTSVESVFQVLPLVKRMKSTAEKIEMRKGGNCWYHGCWGCGFRRQCCFPQRHRHLTLWLTHPGWQFGFSSTPLSLCALLQNSSSHWSQSPRLGHRCSLSACP